MLSNLTPDQRAWYDLMVARHYPPRAFAVAGPLGSTSTETTALPHPGLVFSQYPMPDDWRSTDQRE
jgi:hypothetical protein